MAISLENLVTALDGNYERGRAAGLEEAAKLIDGYAAEEDGRADPDSGDLWRYAASAIRALAEKEPT